MHFGSIQRPHSITGLPCYMAAGRPVPLPRLCLTPANGPAWRITAMLARADGSFQEFHCICLNYVLMVEVLSLWREHPELAMDKFFGYQPPEVPAPAAKPARAGAPPLDLSGISL